MLSAKYPPTTVTRTGTPVSRSAPRAARNPPDWYRSICGGFAASPPASFRTARTSVSVTAAPPVAKTAPPAAAAFPSNVTPVNVAADPSPSIRTAPAEVVRAVVGEGPAGHRQRRPAGDGYRPAAGGGGEVVRERHIRQRHVRPAEDPQRPAVHAVPDREGERQAGHRKRPAGQAEPGVPGVIDRHAVAGDGEVVGDGRQVGVERDEVHAVGERDDVGPRLRFGGEQRLAVRQFPVARVAHVPAAGHGEGGEEPAGLAHLRGCGERGSAAGAGGHSRDPSDSLQAYSISPQPAASTVCSGERERFLRPAAAARRSCVPPINPAGEDGFREPDAPARTGTLEPRSRFGLTGIAALLRQPH